jgi:chorismate--pyruvate lyase
LPSATTPLWPRLLWRPITHWRGPAQPPLALREWLANPGSLTARLIDKSAGKFDVMVLRQVIGRPSPNECAALGIRTSDLALIREVILRGNARPWVFARSLLPLSSLTGDLRHLRKQNNRPLGAFLFSQPHLTRSPLEVARILPEQSYVPPELSDLRVLWGRRSVFRLHGKPLLVSEVFLPDFVASLRREQA